MRKRFSRLAILAPASPRHVPAQDDDQALGAMAFGAGGAGGVLFFHAQSISVSLLNVNNKKIIDNKFFRGYTSRMGRPKLPKAKRKSHPVWTRLTEDTYAKLLEEAGGDPKKVPAILRQRAESN